jgi:adhesin transport system membrane fusion protein
MSRLTTLIETERNTPWRITSAIIGGLIIIFLIWAFAAKLEEVAVAPGSVVPQEQIQTIQHLEGGIIEKIFVTEGDKVEKGEPLIQLNLTPFMANREELQIQLEALQLKRARLMAESAGKGTLSFNKDFANYREELKRAEQQTFRSRQEKLNNEIAQLKDQKSQRELDRKQLQAERSSIITNLSVLREKFRISKDLVKDKLTSRLEHLQLSSELKELEGRLQIVNVSIPRAVAGVEEAENKLKGARLNFQNDAQQELNDVEQAIARTKEALNRADDQVDRTTISSPISGVVKSLNNHTLGGVIQPGQTVMEIVPQSKNLIIEARLNPNDIGFVRKDQKVLVKVNTYDYARYGGLQGTVKSISADSLTHEQTGEPYFLVKVLTAQNHLGTDANSFPITAGMQVMVDIKTGEKSVMEYLLKPVIMLQHESFRER